MAVAHLLVLLPPGVPHTMAAFIPRNPLSSLGCKIVHYTQRVAHNTALCSTRVLSTYQAFTLPQESGVGDAQRKGPRGHWSFLLLLLGAQSPNAHPCSSENHWSSGRTQLYGSQGSWFCSASGTVTGLGYLWSVSDAMFLTLMVWSSGSMVLLLLRHRQRVQYIHTRTGHHGCSPETRVARTILMLVVTFVTFYLLNSVLSFYITAFFDIHLCLRQTSNVLGSCFPTISPFLLLLRDPRTPRFCSWLVRMYG